MNIEIVHVEDWYLELLFKSDSEITHNINSIYKRPYLRIDNSDYLYPLSSVRQRKRIADNKFTILIAKYKPVFIKYSLIMLHKRMLVPKKHTYPVDLIKMDEYDLKKSNLLRIQIGVLSNTYFYNKVITKINYFNDNYESIKDSNKLVEPFFVNKEKNEEIYKRHL